MGSEAEREAILAERQRFRELMDEYNAILDQERVPASAQKRLNEIQDECMAILAGRSDRTTDRLCDRIPTRIPIAYAIGLLIG